MRKNVLFAGLSDDELTKALHFFAADRHSYRRGDYLHRAGSRLRRFGLVLSGTVQVYMDDINGDQMVMASVAPGDTFGESLAFLAVTESPVYIRAGADACVLWLRADALSHANAPDSALACDLTRRFIRLLAMRALTMNNRIQILSKRTLREKLVTFFSQEAHLAGSSSFTVPFDRSGMAAYLGADRSALSRELSRMRGEGIISYERSRFTILTKFDS